MGIKHILYRFDFEEFAASQGRSKCCGGTKLNRIDLSFRQNNILVTRCIETDEERDIWKSSFFLTTLV